MNTKVIILILLIIFSSSCVFKNNKKSFNVLLPTLPPKITPLDSEINYFFYIILQVYTPLLAKEYTGEYKSSIFRTWRANNDHRLFEFCLKDDLIFSNGRRVTNEIVKKHFIYLSEEKLISSKISDVYAKDKCIIIQFDEPSFSFLTELTNYKLSLVDPATIGKDIEVGIGDYYVRSFNSECLILESNRVIKCHVTSVAQLTWHLMKNVPELFLHQTNPNQSNQSANQSPSDKPYFVFISM